MTQTGKCDTCRQRKVKCDEEKPKCGACRKKDRICSYSYGKASAFVVQDPSQMTKHGKSKVAPVIFALGSTEETSEASVSTPSDLQVTTEREAENGQGFFQTLAPMSRWKNGTSRKAAALRRRKLEIYLQQLQAEAALNTIKPSSSETNLIARYVGMLGPGTVDQQPLAILGTWIQSIPSRIGKNRMMDLAVEFFVNSHDVFWNDTYTTRSIARASKEKALKELQLFVFDNRNRPTYDVLLATKMHYAAEALLGIDSMYHAIHAFGLAELLKAGDVADVDDEHFYNLIDNTYIDDVNEAMLAGRKSLYDNEYYLSSTLPPPRSHSTISLSAFQRASIAVMHVFVQCPRLNILVREAVASPQDTAALVSAITLAESMWQVNVPDHVSDLFSECITVRPIPPLEDMKDIMPESFHFDSVQNMIMCTRYWMLLTIFGGLVDTLYRYFPAETSLSLLPERYIMQQIETDAALQLAKSIPWAQSLSKTLPLVPLRLHTPLQVSIGPWYRTIRSLQAFLASSPNLDADALVEINRKIATAERMKAKIIEECNHIHSQWDVSAVAEKPLLEALNTMAGGKIPEWLPVRVRFEAEEGEMVMKLEYENRRGTYQAEFGLEDTESKRLLARDVAIWKENDELNYDYEVEIPHRTKDVVSPEFISETAYRNESMDSRDVANFVHGTGRNLCSTSGWWPSRDDSFELLRSTKLKESAKNVRRPEDFGPGEPLDNVDRHPCLASSFWPQTPNRSRSSVETSSETASLMSTWSNVAWSQYESSDYSSERSVGPSPPSWATVFNSTPSSHGTPNSQ
ncbi:hypothetical protein FB567DRAFT_241756 [Paraphoma chrysanthemicola]|uniref:Zn(2)-C6 fungal-type domain-containing protein n=1 Tax=Paraphoma chrysanthemicola TaxID=798071 RepID=A0A8K0RF21_9PLEO|nr:hypothetical protein FB567DRAFT_241756 [Paraphoma chrysanthemicola]